MAPPAARVLIAVALWCCLCAVSISASAAGFISAGNVAVYADQHIKFVSSSTGRTLGFSDISKYTDGPDECFIASSPDARYLFVLKNDLVASKLSVIVVGIGATQILPLGELAIPSSFYTSECNAYPKNFGVTQQQAASGAISYRLFVTVGCTAPSSVPNCPKNTPVGSSGGTAPPRPKVFKTMAFTYHLGAGGKLGKLRTGPTALLPLPLAQECSYQHPFNTQTSNNRHLVASFYPIKGVINEGVAVFEASLSTATRAGKATEVLTYARTYLADASAYSEVSYAAPATPTSFFAVTSPKAKLSQQQVYYFSAGLVRPYHGGIVESDDYGYSSVNSGNGVAFAIVYNNTNVNPFTGPALLQRTTLSDLKAHSKGKYLATLYNFGDVTVVGSA